MAGSKGTWMADEQAARERPEGGERPGDERRRRLAEAMRANLRRRKAQARAREEATGEGHGSG